MMNVMHQARHHHRQHFFFPKKAPNRAGAHEHVRHVCDRPGVVPVVEGILRVVRVSALYNLAEQLRLVRSDLNTGVA